MPIQSFSIGKDVALDLVHPTLGIVSFGLLTGFNPRVLTTRLISAPITNSGRRVYRIIYDGWEGTFDVDRADGTVDALFDLLESAYFAGAPETYFMITETIKNIDGTIDEFRYRNVVIVPEDGGNWRG